MGHSAPRFPCSQDQFKVKFSRARKKCILMGDVRVKQLYCILRWCYKINQLDVLRESVEVKLQLHIEPGKCRSKTPVTSFDSERLLDDRMLHKGSMDCGAPRCPTWGPGPCSVLYIKI